MFKGMGLDHPTGWVEIALGAIDGQVEGGDRSDQAWLLNLRVTRQVGEMGTMAVFKIVVMLWGGFEKIKAGVGRGTTEGIRCEAVTVPEGEAWFSAYKFSEHLFTGHGHTHG